MNNEVYFATLVGDELVNSLTEKVKIYHEHVDRIGLSRLWEKSYRAYYGQDEDGFTSSEVSRTGVQGELSAVVINEYRNFIQHLHSITTNQKPAFKSRASNTDSKSQTQAVLADGLIDFYMYEKTLSEYTDMSAELGLVLGEGWTVEDWDANAGEIYNVDDKKNPLYQGDVAVTNYGPMEVSRDINIKTAKNLPWVILEDTQNRFDLAAKYPEKADEILGYKSSSEEEFRKSSFGGSSSLDETDQITVFKFIHKKTPAIPEGRRVEFLAGTCLLMDTPLPYRNMSVYRMAPGEIIGSPFGYTIGFDLLGINDMSNALHSIVVTNQTTFGVQNIVAEEGSNVSPAQLSGGLNLLEYRRGAQPPQALNLTSTPPEIFNYIGMLRQTMETISGINSVLRGDAPPNVRSGNAMALLHAQAVQFNSGLQKAYASHLEHVATGLLNLLQDFAEIPRIASIVGEFNRSYLKEFKNTDIENVNRVHVELVNPVSRTAAGRLDIAENLLQGGHVSANEYMSVLETGNLNPMIEGPMRDNLLIRRENEMMANGEQVAALATDHHPTHIQEHRNVLSDPEIRKDPQMINNVTAHMQDHIELVKTTDPLLLAIIGIEAPQQAPAPAQGGGGQEPPANAGVPAGLEGTGVSMPTNPATGEKAMVEGGM